MRKTVGTRSLLSNIIKDTSTIMRNPMLEYVKRRLAALISEKRKKDYSKTINWLRCRLSFSLLRSAIMCLRRYRFTIQPAFQTNHQTSTSHATKVESINCPSPLSISLIIVFLFANSTTLGAHAQEGYGTCPVCLSVCLSVCYHLIVDIVRFYGLTKVCKVLF